MGTLTPSDYLAKSGLNARQKRNAEIIISEFTRAGYGPVVALAAVVNAYAESKLIETAQGDMSDMLAKLNRERGNIKRAQELEAIKPPRPMSVGLFQMYEAGAGAGMTVAERMNPVLATQTMIRKEAGPIQSKVAGSSNLQWASAAFAQHVERHAGGDKENERRKALALALFPQFATVPSAQIPTVNGSALTSGSSGSGMGTGALKVAALLALGLLGIKLASRRK